LVMANPGKNGIHECFCVIPTSMEVGEKQYLLLFPPI